ncbi:MAG: ATPase, partial [Kiritimatiellae bacterium]|nr:ATPase [Kiritimatiellia bacterium]
MRRRSSVALGFLALILVGAILLSSPWARAAGAWGPFGDALFTACSAVCVTGLSVVEVGKEYSHAGIAVLTTLVEIGCIGLMTCGTFLVVAIGRRLSLHREFSLM